jgi:hypothetical protein
MGDDGKAAATKDFLAWGLGLLRIDGVLLMVYVLTQL